jgi:hypothetical protein
MNKIIVRIPNNLDFAGLLEIQNANGKRIAGPFHVCARADDQLARNNKNPRRNPLLPFGDMPLGEYRIAQIIESGSGTSYAADEFGSAGIVLLEPKHGDAALADANGRFGFFIQGGALARNGALRPTNGSLRLSNRDQRKLIGVLRHLDHVTCHCIAGNIKSKIAVAVSSPRSADAGNRSRKSFPGLLAGAVGSSSQTTRRSWLQMMLSAAGATAAASGMLSFVLQTASSREAIGYPDANDDNSGGVQFNNDIFKNSDNSNTNDVFNNDIFNKDNSSNDNAGVTFNNNIFNKDNPDDNGADDNGANDNDANDNGSNDNANTFAAPEDSNDNSTNNPDAAPDNSGVGPAPDEQQNLNPDINITPQQLPAGGTDTNALDQLNAEANSSAAAAAAPTDEDASDTAQVGFDKSGNVIPGNGSTDMIPPTPTSSSVAMSVPAAPVGMNQLDPNDPDVQGLQNAQQQLTQAQQDEAQATAQYNQAVQTNPGANMAPMLAAQAAVASALVMITYENNQVKKKIMKKIIKKLPYMPVGTPPPPED